LSNKLEIILSQANNQPVKLASMSSDALDSFLKVVSALKAITESTINKEELCFSIQEGSAMCAVEAPAQFMNSIYEEMDLAIQGKSDDKEITKYLRIIQEQIKKESFAYQFKYKENANTINIDKSLRNAKKITVKRKTREPYQYKLKILSGYLNQIGGQNPNYHFDYGLKDSITIDCSKHDAMNVINYLYQDVQALLLTKEWKIKDKKDDYIHKVILDKSLVPIFKEFITSYYKHEDLVEKLTILHDFVDEQFRLSNDSGFKFLKHLLIAFNDKNYHLSEIKTLLIISKPFKEKTEFKKLRDDLFLTYQNKKVNV
jgi:hypothetical protein